MDYNKYGVYLPFFIMERSFNKFLGELKKMTDMGLRYVMCSNTGQIKAAKSFGLEVYTDYRLNLFNSYSLEKVRNDEVSAAVLSFELNFGQISDIHQSMPFGILAYGHLPLMTFRNCIIKTFESGNNCEEMCNNGFAITDRKNVRFNIIKGYDCSNILLNSRPVYTPDMKNIQKIGLNFFLLQFTIEDKSEVDRIMADFTEKKINLREYTRGVYNKKV